MYPWALDNLIEETSIYTSSEQIVLYMKSEHPKKCILGRENDRALKLRPCRDKPVCCDESSDPDGPFLLFLHHHFQKSSSPTSLYNFEKELLTEINVAPAQLHPNSWAFVGVFPFSAPISAISHQSSVEVFLHFFEAKHLGRQLWVSFNGVARRALLSLFQQSYKGFKGKFLKIHCNTIDPTLLDGFPLYWTEKPRFQGAKCLEDMPQQDREVCLFFSSLKVVFDTATLTSKVFYSVGLKTYIGILRSLTFTNVNLCACLLIYLCSLADNMLGRQNKKDFIARAKKMKAAAQASPAKDLKLKVVVEVVPSDDE